MKFPSIQNIYFALMFFYGAAKTTIEPDWENRASNVLSTQLLWQFSQATCLEVI